jgi:hypothetical protein
LLARSSCPRRGNLGSLIFQPSVMGNLPHLPCRAAQFGSLGSSQGVFVKARFAILALCITSHRLIDFLTSDCCFRIFLSFILPFFSLFLFLIWSCRICCSIYHQSSSPYGLMLLPWMLHLVYSNWSLASAELIHCR